MIPEVNIHRKAKFNSQKTCQMDFLKYKNWFFGQIVKTEIFEKESFYKATCIHNISTGNVQKSQEQIKNMAILVYAISAKIQMKQTVQKVYIYVTNLYM